MSAAKKEVLKNGNASYDHPPYGDMTEAVINITSKKMSPLLCQRTPPKCFSHPSTYIYLINMRTTHQLA